MLSSFEFWIAQRYVRSRRRVRGNRFISFISGLSAAGIALGVAALILVLSVMNGFQREVRDRMLSVIPHVEVGLNAEPVGDWQVLAAKVQALPETKNNIVGVAPVVSGQAMATRGDVLRGVFVRGIDPKAEAAVSELGKQVRQGTIEALVPGEFGVLLGRNLALALGIQVGDKLTLMAPAGTVTPTGFVPRLKAFTVVGVFDSGHSDYDSAMVAMHWEDASKFFRTEGVTGLRLKITDMFEAPQVARKLVNQLPPGFYARDWSRENSAWFAAVQVEKRMMFIILTLIIAVAAFNLVSMLVMTVTEKHSDIAILRTYGATPKSIRLIFMIQGALIGWIGALVGIVLGVIGAWNVGALVKGIESMLGIQFLPEGIYLITSLPSELRWNDVWVIGLTSFILSVLATIYPSRQAARLAPTEALRHE